MGVPRGNRRKNERQKYVVGCAIKTAAFREYPDDCDLAIVEYHGLTHGFPSATKRAARLQIGDYGNVFIPCVVFAGGEGASQRSLHAEHVKVVRGHARAG